MAEDKLIFGLNAKAVSQLTLAKIRKVYSRADNKAIAKQVSFCFFLSIFNYLFIKLYIQGRTKKFSCWKGKVIY